MSRLARKGVTKLQPYQPGKPIDEVKRELLLEEVYKLASNENALGPSPKALEAIKKALGQVNRYPDGSCYCLRAKLADRLKVKPENLICGNGSDEIVELIVQAFMDEGEEAIVAEPTFLEYRLITEAAGRSVKTVPLVNFKYDLNGMRRAITKKTKVVFIANPDNPTGSYVTETELRDFLSGLPEDVIAVIDEAYYDFVDATDYPDTMRSLEGRNILILRTFSKAYGLAGLRVGYGLASTEFIDCLNRVRQPFNVNSLAQVAAAAALDDEEHLKRTKTAIAEGKKLLYKAFGAMGLPCVATQANFILVDVKRDGREVFEKLLRQGVIVRDMKPYKLDNYIRVTIGTDGENNKFVIALKKILKEPR